MDERQPTPQQKSHRPTHSKPANFTRAFAAIERNSGQCSLCNGGHLPSVCRKFQTPDSRKNRLLAQRRCLNCLREGHQISQCESPKRCRNCGGKHHFIVCTRQRGREIDRTFNHSTNGQTNSFQSNSNFSPANYPAHRPAQFI
uniref:Uncharacterized protein n=1 Tax=Meloidogyne enterolobii TaxID=390850 RepID=A0A6V7Y5J1_MELEN|nr:unnamed protein product [Meloidogyne enterolobii]